MPQEQSKHVMFDKVIRVAEIALIFATVYLMYLGYELQFKTHKLQTRPYVAISPPENTIARESEMEYIVSLDLENTSNFSANNVRFYGGIIVDGEFVHGINAHGFRSTPKETTELTEATENCQAGFPDIGPSKSIKVCVQNTLRPIDIQPSKTFHERISLSKTHFDKLMNAKTKSESGLFFIVTFEGEAGKELYSSRLGLLPYPIRDKQYEVLVF